MAFVNKNDAEPEVIPGGMPTTPAAVVVSNVATSFTFYPLVYARSLMQVGYEPVLPVEGRTLSGAKALFYPNIFGYLRHLSNENGLSSLWTGYWYRLPAIVISSQLEPRVASYIEQVNSCHDDKDTELVQVCKKCANDVTSKVTVTVMLYPLQVMMYRAIVSTIGGEILYRSPIKAVADILKNEGIAGFYSGLVPTVFSEALGITIVHALNYLFNRYVVTRFGLDESMTGVLRLLFAMFVGRISYPFHVVSTNMAITNSGLRASRLLTAKPFSDSSDCFKYMRSKHALRLGEDFFWRRYLGSPSAIISTTSRSPYIVKANY